MSGFTLIETLVAVSVLLAILLGPIGLISHSLFGVSFSRNMLIANNLAQEGIELVRAVRDNNIICVTLGGSPVWNEDPDIVGGGPSILSDYYEMDPFNSTTLTCGSASINTPRPVNRSSTSCNTPILIDTNGLYNYISGTPTGFTRCVQVCSPPNAAPCFAIEDSDIPIGDQMEVVSTVSWVERGFPRSAILRDRLYNWK